MISDIKHRLRDPAVLSVLAECMFQPSETKLRAVSERYFTDSNLTVLGLERDGCIVGCIGIDLTEHDKIVLLHVAVDPNHRGRGIGREMITDLSQLYPGRRMETETDGDAVDFYRKCGFSITDLGDKYSGVKRYLCKLTFSDFIK